MNILIQSSAHHPTSPFNLIFLGFFTLLAGIQILTIIIFRRICAIPIEEKWSDTYGLFSGYMGIILMTVIFCFGGIA